MNQTTRSHFLFRVCFYSILLLTSVVAVCGTIAFWTAFDAGIGYMNASPLAVVCNLASILAVGIAIILPSFIPSQTLPTVWPAPSGMMGYLFGGIPAVAFVAFAALTVVTMPFPASKLSLVSLCFAPGAAAYFMVSAIPSMQKKSLLLLIMGIFPIFWALLCIADTYTDWTIAINSPIKLLIQFGCAGVMLMMTVEQRFRLGKAMPRLALCLYGLTILLCLGAGIPLTLISTDDMATLRYAVCLFAAGLYAVKRMADYVAALSHTPAEGQET